MKLLAALGLVLGLGAPVLAQNQTPVYSQPLGIALETLAYPHPVQFHELEVEGERVRMAYMDVMPPVGARFPARTPVLLLHGKNFYGSYWESTIRNLTTNGYRVIVPDQIGFGKSSKPDIPYSFDLLAQNTASLLDKLGVNKVHVVGHSMGGMLAVRFARNYPTRTQTMTLENPIGLEDYRAIVPAVPFETLYQNELQATDPAKLRPTYTNYFVTWKPEYERFVEVRSRVALSGEYPRWAKASARTYQMIFQQPTVYDLPLVTAPSLVVIGQKDRTVVGANFASPEARKNAGDYPSLGKKTAQALPNARLVELLNIGHIPHIEDADTFHSALLNFLHSHN